MKILNIEKIMKQTSLTDKLSTKHADTERKIRITVANQLIADEKAKLIDSFSVDCGHKNGKEIHNVYSNGVIKIYNMNSKKFITVLIGNKNQVSRYYKACGIEKYMPKAMITFCIQHKRLGLNEDNFENLKLKSEIKN